MCVEGNRPDGLLKTSSFDYQPIIHGRYSRANDRPTRKVRILHLPAHQFASMKHARFTGTLAEPKPSCLAV